MELKEHRFLQVMTTLDDHEAAEALARHLVAERLVACAQVVGPVHSTYHWQGAIESGQEWLVIGKTNEALYKEVERAINLKHPYSCPEILALPVVEGNPAYLRWMGDELKRAESKEA